MVRKDHLYQPALCHTIFLHACSSMQLFDGLAIFAKGIFIRIICHDLERELAVVVPTVSVCHFRICRLAMHFYIDASNFCVSVETQHVKFPQNAKEDDAKKGRPGNHDCAAENVPGPLIEWTEL